MIAAIIFCPYSAPDLTAKRFLDQGEGSAGSACVWFGASVAEKRKLAPEQNHL